MIPVDNDNNSVVMVMVAQGEGSGKEGFILFRSGSSCTRKATSARSGLCANLNKLTSYVCTAKANILRVVSRGSFA